MQNWFKPIVHEYCYARSNVCCPAYMKKEVQIFPPAPVTTPSSFQTSVSSPLFCLFPVVLVAQSIQHAILTQPDRTRFFLIFTYLRGRSHWNSRDYASNVAICHFLKPETNKGDFRLYFELVEKSCRGRVHIFEQN